MLKTNYRVSRLMLVLAGAFALAACASKVTTPGLPTAQPEKNQVRGNEVDQLLAAAYARIAAGDLAGAEQSLLKAREKSPDNLWVALNLGVVYQRTGRLEEAKTEYHKVIREEGTHTHGSRAGKVSDGSFQRHSAGEIAFNNLETLLAEPVVAPVSNIRPQVSASPENRPPLAVAPSPSPKAALLNLLNQWRGAWVTRDIDAYLAFYASDFKGKDANPAAWQANRRRVISAARSIELQINGIDLEIASSGDRAVINFEQLYRAKGMVDRGTKQLYMRRVNNRWFIEQEVFNPA